MDWVSLVVKTKTISYQWTKVGKLTTSQWLGRLLVFLVDKFFSCKRFHQFTSFNLSRATNIQFPKQKILTNDQNIISVNLTVTISILLVILDVSPHFDQSWCLGSRPANTNQYDFNQSISKSSGKSKIAQLVYININRRSFDLTDILRIKKQNLWSPDFCTCGNQVPP